MSSSGNKSSSHGSRKDRRSILEILTSSDEVDRAVQRGIRQALLEHKKLGHSIVVWLGGKVVEIPPDEIPV